MSLEDLRRVAGYRVIQDVRLTNSVLAVVEGKRAFNDCQRANDGLMSVITNKDAAIAGLSEQVDAHMERADKWQRKAKRRGKVVGMLLPVTIGAVALLVLK